MKKEKLVECTAEQYAFLSDLGGGDAEAGLGFIIAERAKLMELIERFGISKYINIANVIGRLRGKFFA